MRVVLFIFASFLFFTSCTENIPRKPVLQKSGSFIDNSVKRTKALLAKEEEAIKNIIALDSSNVYTESSYGFWYTIESKNTDANTTLNTDDEALISYCIMGINGDTIYTPKDIGVQPIKVDKTKLFFRS